MTVPYTFANQAGILPLAQLDANFAAVGDSANVSYNEGGTGAVTRTVQNKLQESVSVKDFGAVGDGVADDTAAIQATITASGYGGCVYIPKGTYKINSVLNVPAVVSNSSGVSFIGDGVASIIKAGASGMTAIFNITGTNAKFTNIKIDSNSTDVTSGFYVNIFGNADVACTIQECTILGFPVGILATGQNHYIENNFFQNNTRHIKFSNDGRNSSISGNYMIGGSFGIVFDKSTQQAEGTRIVNNTILATVGSGAGIQILAGLEITIIANIIDQTGSSSPAIQINPSSGNTASSIKIIGNWIAAGQNSYGVFAGNTNNHLYFTNNTFVSNNNLSTLDAINLTNTNTYAIIGNRFLMNLAVGSLDLKTSSVSNGTIIANDSSVSGSGVIDTSLNSGLSINSNFITPNNMYAQVFSIGVSGPFLRGGTGNPNGVVSGVAGSIFMRSDGASGSHIYICQSGTTWTAIAGV